HRPSLRLAVGLDRTSRPVFAAANHFDAELRQKMVQLVAGAVTLGITQLRSSSPRMKGRTEFPCPAWCRRRRATDRRPNAPRGRGRDLGLSEPGIWPC